MLGGVGSQTPHCNRHVTAGIQLAGLTGRPHTHVTAGIQLAGLTGRPHTYYILRVRVNTQSDSIAGPDPVARTPRRCHNNLSVRYSPVLYVRPPRPVRPAGFLSHYILGVNPFFLMLLPLEHPTVPHPSTTWLSTSTFDPPACHVTRPPPPTTPRRLLPPQHSRSRFTSGEHLQKPQWHLEPHIIDLPGHRLHSPRFPPSTAPSWHCTRPCP